MRISRCVLLEVAVLFGVAILLAQTRRNSALSIDVMS